jgi:hypothetical protein
VNEEPKTYSITEANELLPYLAPALVELREKYEKAAEIKRAMTRASVSNGGSSQRERWTRTLARVDELMEKLAEWGLLLRDIETGLVDFPAVIDGRAAFLCWRLGEPRVAYFHLADEGFQGRRPL